MRRLFLIALVVVTALMLFASPVYADMADPDSTPSVEQIDVYRNLLETGDRFYLVYANIPYTSVPTITMPNAFIWRLLDTDGVTELGFTTGYAYNESGYGYNVFGMYFTAADNLTWQETYTIRLSGNPSAFDNPKYYDYPINMSDYSTLTTSADNKAALTARLLALAAELDNRWGLSSAASLLLETESGTVLSIYGEAFFRGAIYGLQALAPAAFRLVVEDITAEDRAWDLEYSENLTTQYTGTWIEPARTGGGTIFGVGYDLTSIILVMVLSIGLIIGNVKITNDAWSGMIDVSIFLVAAPYIDLIPLSFTALICAIFVLYEGTKVKAFVS